MEDVEVACACLIPSEHTTTKTVCQVEIKTRKKLVWVKLW